VRIGEGAGSRLFTDLGSGAVSVTPAASSAPLARPQSPSGLAPSRRAAPPAPAADRDELPAGTWHR
jgi:hypothetical protein